ERVRRKSFLDESRALGGSSRIQSDAVIAAVNCCATQRQVQIPSSMLPWNPTLAPRTRKDGAPGLTGGANDACWQSGLERQRCGHRAEESDHGCVGHLRLWH